MTITQYSENDISNLSHFTCASPWWDRIITVCNSCLLNFRPKIGGNSSRRFLFYPVLFQHDRRLAITSFKVRWSAFRNLVIRNVVPWTAVCVRYSVKISRVWFPTPLALFADSKSFVRGLVPLHPGHVRANRSLLKIFFWAVVRSVVHTLHFNAEWDFGFSLDDLREGDEFIDEFLSVHFFNDVLWKWIMRIVYRISSKKNLSSSCLQVH